MSAAICTLYENHYHLGVGALANSLYKNGFRGTFWVGYRGDLPTWAKPLKNESGVSIYNIADGMDIKFILLETNYHFTNYKPDFMLKLWEKYCPEIDNLYYFDPDIVIKCEWDFYDKWVEFGVTLCEDVNSPMLSTHPVRKLWKEYYKNTNLNFTNEMDIYVNGGYVGLKKENIDFLINWKEIQDCMAKDIGGLQNAFIPSTRRYIFHKTDQDALNIALMTWENDYSLLGKEGMDIIPGGFTMSHALGGPKPWMKNFTKYAIKGHKTTMAEKEFWKNVESPINLFSKKTIMIKKIDLKFSSLINKLVN